MKAKLLKRLRAEARQKIFIEEVREFGHTHYLLHNTTVGLWGPNITRYDKVALATQFVYVERICFIKNTIHDMRTRLKKDRNKRILPL